MGGSRGQAIDRRDDQQLLVVDEQDTFLGRYVSRGLAHTGSGERHRAFVCAVIDAGGRVLVQKRRHWLWDGLWDLSAVSHVLHFEGRDETYAEAAGRALEREMGIRGVVAEKLAGFNYYAKHPVGDGCENEYCAVMIARYDGALAPNSEWVYEHRWVGLDEFRADVLGYPERYTPWAHLAVLALDDAGRWPTRQARQNSPES